MYKMKKLSLIIVLFLSVSIYSNAQIPKLQSIFIYNFTKYIEWPASYNTGNFVIGVLGQSPLIKELNNLSKLKKAGNQPIVITRFHNVEEISKCNILFVPTNKSSQINDITNKLKGKSTLIITEKKGMAKQGAGINFVIIDNKQRFELNKANILKCNLKVSPSLVNLAILVK